ncbi:MAG: hypothetical protein ACPHID_02480 [Thermoplasmatota archaeon]
MDLVGFLASRVDAARQMMSVPRRGAEASGRLFVAKRCHEAAKSGPVDLDAILQDVLDGLSEAAHEGARKEAEVIERRLTGAAK